MPFQRRQQCQTCLKCPPVSPIAYLTCWNSSRASHLTTSIKSNTVITSAEAELVWADHISYQRTRWCHCQKCHQHRKVFDTHLIPGHANKNALPSFSLIKIPLRAQRGLLPHPSFLSSMVKYVNKMSKVILQRETKEKRGAEGEDSHKIPAILHNISQRGASFQPEPSSRGASLLHRITHRKSHTQKNKISFQLQPSKGLPPFTLLVTELSHSCWFLRDGAVLLLFLARLWLNRWDKISVRVCVCVRVWCTFVRRNELYERDVCETGSGEQEEKKNIKETVVAAEAML